MGREGNKVVRELDTTSHFLLPPLPQTGSLPWISGHMANQGSARQMQRHQSKPHFRPSLRTPPFPPHKCYLALVSVSLLRHSQAWHFLWLLCINIWYCKEQDGPGPGRAKEDRIPKENGSRALATLLSVQSRYLSIRDNDSPVGSGAARITVALGGGVSHTLQGELRHLSAGKLPWEGGTRRGRAPYHDLSRPNRKLLMEHGSKH